MKHFPLLKKVYLLIVALLLLSGCLTALEKPTGLEEKKEKLVHHEREFENKKVDSLHVASTSEKTEIETKEANLDEESVDELKEEKVESNQTTTNVSGDKKGDKKKNEPPQSKGSTVVKEKNSEPAKVTQSKGSSSNQANNPKDVVEEVSEEPSLPKSKPKEKIPSKSTVTYSIVITTEGSYGQKVCQEKNYPTCPEDGRAEIPLAPTVVEIEDEDSVLDVLIAVTMQNRIHMDYRGGRGATAYVQGMGNVYEFDRGQGSGWMYRVNGIFPDRGAGVVPLCDGDVVEWLYTTNLGIDLNADLEPFRRDGKCP